MDTTAATTGAPKVSDPTVEALLDRFRRGEITLPRLAASCFEAGRRSTPNMVVEPFLLRTDAGQDLPLTDADSPIMTPSPVWFLIYCSRPVTKAEISHLRLAAAYAWKAEVRADPIGKPVLVTNDAFFCEVDLTTSKRSDAHEAISDFTNTFTRLLHHGSPLRTSDRAGAGTAGTRAVEPFADVDFSARLMWPAVPVLAAQEKQTTAKTNSNLVDFDF